MNRTDLSRLPLSALALLLALGATKLHSQSDITRTDSNWYDSAWSGVRLVPVDAETFSILRDATTLDYIRAHYKDELEFLDENLCQSFSPLPIHHFSTTCLKAFRSIPGEKTQKKFLLELARRTGLDPEFDFDMDEAERLFYILEKIFSDLSLVEYDELYWLLTGVEGQPQIEGIVAFDSLSGTTQFFPRMYSAELNVCLNDAVDSLIRSEDNPTLLLADGDETFISVERLRLLQEEAIEDRYDPLPTHLLAPEFTWMVTPNNLATEFSPLFLAEGNQKVQVAISCNTCSDYGISYPTIGRLSQQSRKVKVQIDDVDLFLQKVQGQFRVIALPLVVEVRNLEPGGASFQKIKMNVLYDRADWK
ncbi:MAG: hypothetical protein AB7H80_02395 [Candidatus Kapaibacterium sp.]